MSLRVRVRSDAEFVEGADLGTKNVASLRETKRLEARVLGSAHLTLLTLLSVPSLYHLARVPHPFLDSHRIVLSIHKCHSQSE